MTQLFANNAEATLASGVTAVATSIPLATGKGALFPSPTGGDYFRITLTQPNAETSWEIATIVGRSTDTLTVGIPGSASANVAGRGAEGTTAAAWSAADKVEARFTAGTIAMAAEANGCIYENNRTITADYTMTKSGMCVGPLTTASGVALTIASGERLVIL